MASYQDFLDCLAQLQEDQSLFESELGTAELQGVQHEEIIKLGKQLLKKLRQFAKMGRSFAETLPPDFVSKLTDSIVSYRDLIMPPKVCGGYCPCLKPARSGIEYDKKMMVVKAKMASSIFLCQAVIIEHRGEAHNMQSMHFTDYANKMNSILNSLSEIKCSGSEKALENARKKLQPCIVSIEKFISNFEEDFSEGSFKVDATRRLKSTQELLVSRQHSDGEGISTGMPISRRVLVKAQSTLQEIMNSAANISSAKAKEHLLELDKLSTDLKKARDQEINTFNHLEDGMHENNLMDMLHRLREDSEVLHSDANSKVRDSIKRWSTVKTLSVPRKVVEYQEETEYLKPGSISIGPPPIADIDPTKLIKKTGTKMNSMGQQLAFGMVNVVQVATSEVGSVAFQGAMGVKNIASIGANSAAKVAKSALGTDSDPPPSAPSPQVKQGKGVTPQSKGNSKFNPLDSIKDGFDSITGNNHPPPPPPPAKKSAGKFNPLDSIMDGIDSVTGANQPPKKSSSGSSLGLFNPLEGF